jgi:hypothetical protein
MEKRLWEYRIQSPNEASTTFYANLHGITQLMVFDQNTLINHTITESEQAPEAPEKSICLDAELPFTLIPDAFKETGIPGWEGATRRFPVEGAVLCYGSHAENSYHAAVPVYLLAQEASKQGDVVYCYCQQDRCIIFVFRGGQCELANSYPVQGESEIMYFCLAAAKKSGADLKQLQVKLLGNDTKTLVQALERFGVHAAAVQLELPYPAGEYPPYPAESFLLCQLHTCVLQEAN